ncbi:sensor histidine kinase [Cellulosilyticum sp. I15G10I2]|uniref:sensor histidine kinase n=1 Tax=Cellulosilyticum sp. I15G10I2 TaxID=1892843 RepID=UPI00085C55A9|nr:HAMP domain-containing sensor histidine kinase [Cellulosilyticum sp. I15G10I2]
MKFWQKAFIGILIIFIVSINISSYLTSKHSFSLNMQRDKNRALGEYHFIRNGILEAMNSNYYREEAEIPPVSMESVMRSYANYYRKQDVFLELNHSNELLFTNIPFSVPYSTGNEELDSNAVKLQILSNSGKRYLYISGRVQGQLQDYTLTYVRDLSELYHTHSQLIRYLITVSVSVEIVLTLVLLLFLRQLTQPIRILQTATRKISSGVYDDRISIPGKDEFHDLAENFNQMASSIQEKITELDKNAQDKQRLVDNLAHELRTPLTAIRGYGEYLQNANASEQNRIKAAAYIISETDRMQNLAFKLLDLALIRNSKPDVQRIIPSELFHQVSLVLAPKLKEKSIKLDIHSSLNELAGDSILLQSLLVNLVDNAVKASAENSSIQLSAYLDTVPILEVKDFGCGMNAEQTALVCEPFYRVDKARSRSSGGIGLGLSLCREIAHLHGAQLKISSCLEKGTSVQIVFTTSLQPAENSVIYNDV